MDDYLVPVFDIGGVFVDWDPMYLYRKIFNTEEDARWFLDNICTSEWNLEFDAGTTYAEGVAQLITRHPAYWSEIQAYDLRWREMVQGLFEGTVAIHDELVAAEVPTFAITNFSWEKWMSVLPEWEFASKFDGTVVSGLEKLVKPDPRIYTLFCDKFSLAPESCVFIDDKQINVDAAKGVGMKAVQFTSPEALRADLIDLGLPLKA